ncbi:hypothetical protein NC651_035972 [Populus alba x Populus x berolinensis]|nr:hypothetical protein NC651_035972 [Populus alba x Populus x berolinensis]
MNSMIRLSLWKPCDFHRPGQKMNSTTRYAYSEGEDLDEEGISLTTGDIANKLERNALVEDLEEDKRE